MTLRYSVDVRNAKLDAVQAAVGASAVMKMFSGAEPANCAAPDPAGLLCTISLPADWMNGAADGVKTLKGRWTGFASAAGDVASWRIYDAAGAACRIQGGTDDLIFDNVNLKPGQALTVTGLTLIDRNA